MFLMLYKDFFFINFDDMNFLNYRQEGLGKNIFAFLFKLNNCQECLYENLLFTFL